MNGPVIFGTRRKQWSYPSKVDLAEETRTAPFALARANVSKGKFWPIAISDWRTHADTRQQLCGINGRVFPSHVTGVLEAQ